MDKFKQEEVIRKKIYKSIYQNLTEARNLTGLSPLRRLEISYLPLDPLMVEYIFSAMRSNICIQELILTDGSLNHCDL